LKDRKVDVLQYPGAENPAGTIYLVRHSYQIQRDPLFHSSTLPTQSRRDRIRRATHKKSAGHLRAASAEALPLEKFGLL
jgi:hypothetical protein